MEARKFSSRTLNRSYNKKKPWWRKLTHRRVAQPRPVGFLLRFAAYVLDFLICVVFFAAFLFFSGGDIAFGVIHGSVLFFILYKPTMEFMYGATLGKMMLNMAVVGEDGRMITMAAAFLRNAAYLLLITEIIAADLLQLLRYNLPATAFTALYLTCQILLFIDVLVMIVHPRKRALHDLLAGTHCCEEIQSTTRTYLHKRLRVRKFQPLLRRTYISASE